jgi:dihydroorotase
VIQYESPFFLPLLISEALNIFQIIFAEILLLTMTILVRKALIIDPNSPYHNSVQDILISNGVISEIAESQETVTDEVIELEGLVVSPGWIDIFSHFCDPGQEQKETLESGSAAAVAGGFTKVMVVPNTIPAIDSKSHVEYIVHKSLHLPITILPIGAVTKGCQGKELAEMYDMKNSGAVAFTDGTSPVQSSGLLMKALQYVKAFDGVVIQVPDDKNMSAHGLMNEGITSTQLGLPGIPALAEELMIKRDIDLVRYTGSKLHFTGVSTANSIELIRQGKSEGLQVSCSVTPYHLFFSEEDLVNYDTNLKVSPPLRTKADVKALQKAVLNGTVDCIASHHFPQHWDNKICEFEYAKNGMISLQSAFSLINTTLPNITSDRLIEIFSTSASKLFQLEAASIKKGSPAELTLFSRNQSYVPGSDNNRSKSSNSPLFGRDLSGKVIGVINKGKVFLNN